MNLSYFLLGSSGSFSTTIDGTLDLAFNDNFYVDNSGYFNFNLFSGETLVGTKQVLGNYSDWQSSFNLPANATYNYTADGYIFNDYTSAFSGSGVRAEIYSTGSGVVPSWVNTGFLSGRGNVFLGTGLTNPFPEPAYITLRSGLSTSGLFLTRFRDNGTEVSTESFAFSGSGSLVPNQEIRRFWAKSNERFLLWSSNSSGNPSGFINTVFNFSKPTGNNDKWTPDGLTCTLGRSISGKSLKIDVSNSAVGPRGFYFSGTILNPLGVSSYVTAFSQGTSDDFYLNGSPIPSTNLGDSVSFNYTFLLEASERFNYAFYNNNNGFVGGGVVFYVNPVSGSFLYSDLTAYSLMGRYRGNTAPGFTGDIIVSPLVPPCKTGYVPPTGGYFPPTAPPIINSGQLLLSITNTGSPCSNQIINKITEFEVMSYYPDGHELSLDVKFTDNNSYSKYLSFTEDLSYRVNYTGYILASGISPTTNITGYIPTYQYFSGLVPYQIKGSDGGFQVCYSYEMTGSGLIASGTGILQRYFGQALTGLIANNSGYIQYDTYFYQSGTGVISEFISGFDPQINIYQDGNFLDYNDDWLNNPYSNQVRKLTTGRNIYLPSVEAANLFDVVGSSGLSIKVSKSPKYSQTSFLRKNSTTIQLVSETGYNYDYSASSLAAWASYRVDSGTNSKNVIGYALEIIDDLLLVNQESVNTGQLRDVPPSLFASGTDIRSEYLTYCIVSKSLDCEDKEFNDVEVCFTGAPDSAAYKVFVSGVLKKFKDNAVTSFDPPGLLNISSGVVPSYFRYWSGEIEYNTFVSGDSVRFDLYPFDYTGLYRQYFNVDPAYPSTGVNFTYPNDFTNITGLVSKINNVLSGVSFPVWYPYSCVSGSGTPPIYIDGGLLSAKVKNLPSGDVNYNNVIQFLSLRNNTGYNMSLQLQSRAIQKQNDSTKLKYLLPSYVQLQGSNDNSIWTTLDTRSGINWLGIDPIKRNFTGLKSGVPDNLNIININNDEGDEVFVDETGVVGGYQNLYSFIQSGSVVLSADCPPIVFEREISIIKPTGFPINAIFDPKTCGPKEKEEEGDGEKEKNEPSSGQSTSGNPVYISNYLRTGFVLSSGINNQPLTGVSYDYYRVYFSGFSALNTNYETLSSTFIVKNINLYSSLVNEIPVHTGENICVIGADYSLKVQGAVLVPLTGQLITSIGKNSLGVYSLNNQTVIMPLSGLQSGSLVKFNNRSGRLISNSGTGVITDRITGTGCFSTGVIDWFYNPATEQITFDRDFQSCITGSGNITGQYVRLKPAVVNQQLAGGGFLGNSFNITVTTGATFTGISNIDFLVQNLTGIYTFTGVTGGYAALGYLNINTGFNFALNSNPVDYVAGGITGYVNSKAILDYGTPLDFDWVSINNNSITYNGDSGNWIAPDYFSTSGQLLSIINSNPFVFLVTGYVSNNKIILESLLSGQTGNNILINAGRGLNTGNQTPYFNANTLVSGQDLYRKIYGTGVYSGHLSAVFYNTGYFVNNNATGFITGFVPTFQGVRTFTGIWGLVTGNFFTGYNNFLQNGFTGVSGLSYRNTIGGTSYAITPQNIDMGLLYNDMFDTQTNTDIAKLTVSGVNLSGVSKLITGVFQIVI